uniref:Smr domain-containing protein n=1 Tax=Rhodosorus marinus TaxID=101924 RepID=A0A7S2ZUA5_9RHOD|mmetsp:Transcript_32133/g.125381  ORF Transcript_32133/g.125381 Transcript_32133/m.125381 type:complete len:108 (+) Transcript_32133:251-574(+)
MSQFLFRLTQSRFLESRFHQKTSVDLHGYTVEDALKLVSLKLDCEERTDGRSGRRIEFITGRGESCFPGRVFVARKHLTKKDCGKPSLITPVALCCALSALLPRFDS